MIPSELLGAVLLRMPKFWSLAKLDAEASADVGQRRSDSRTQIRQIAGSEATASLTQIRLIAGSEATASRTPIRQIAGSEAR